jgi:hypothetical protein
MAGSFRGGGEASNVGGGFAARLLEFPHAVNRRIARRGLEADAQEISDDR